MSENEETLSAERVEGEKYVLKKVIRQISKKMKVKVWTGKVDVKEDATSEEGDTKI